MKLFQLFRVSQMLRFRVRILGKRYLPFLAMWWSRMLYDSKFLQLRSFTGKLCRLFYRPALPHNEGNAVYLHLGCGRINHPQFINIDILRAPHIHYVRNIDNLSIFKNCSVDLIYASHCLEHFSFSVVQNVLKEWHRVLKSAGTLRLSVPDFDLLKKIYEETGNNIDKILRPLMGGQVNSFDFHKALFNRKNLTLLLETSGFQNVRMWTPGSSKLTTFDDWSARFILVNDKKCPISLNMEAVK